VQRTVTVSVRCTSGKPPGIAVLQIFRCAAPLENHGVFWFYKYYGALHLWKTTGNFGSTNIAVRCTCSSVLNFVGYERLAVLECLVTLLGEPFFKFCK
jgi:hypothetical protein